MEQMRVQHRFFLVADEGDDVAKCAKSGADRFRADHRRAVGNGPHTTAPTAGRRSRRRRWGRATGGQTPDQVPRRRHVRHVAQPDQHHLRRGAAVGGDFHLADALQQHLPGAGQHRNGQAVGEFSAAGAFGLGQFVAFAQGGD